MIEEEKGHQTPKSAPSLPTRILGIDYGLARLGVALSDERKIIASPLTTVQAEKRMVQTVTKLCREIEQIEAQNRCNIQKIIIGIPLRMNGQVGMMADEVKVFVELLKKKVSCEVITWDERLSSLQAERSLKESQMTRKSRSKVVDKVTAAIILQSYLDMGNLHR